MKWSYLVESNIPLRTIGPKYKRNSLNSVAQKRFAPFNDLGFLENSHGIYDFNDINCVDISSIIREGNL